MAGNAEQAGGSLKRSSPGVGRPGLRGNEINFEEEIVMGDNSTNVIPFNFGKQQVRTLHLDEDEKGLSVVQTPGGEQEMLIINESGLYSAILRSRKAEAKRFKKWVTVEVLPAIRKHGRYEDSKGVMMPMVDDILGKPGALRLGNIMRCRVPSYQWIWPPLASVLRSRDAMPSASPSRQEKGLGSFLAA